MNELKTFKFWCKSVLPVVYDESLSYYEVLCKVVKYINGLIETDKEIISDIDDLKKDLEIVQKWIADFNYDYAREVIEDAIGTMVFFGLTDDGYFVAYIPDSWNDITFETTGYDVQLDIMPEYGHLCLSY